MEKHVVMADINTTNQVSLVSIPAFGSIPMKNRIKKMISKILNDMHHTDGLNEAQISRQEYKENKKKQSSLQLTELFLIMKVKSLIKLKTKNRTN